MNKYVPTSSSLDPGDYSCNLAYRVFLDMNVIGVVRGKAAFVHLNYKDNNSELVKAVEFGIHQWLT
jgi:hypothetical protein